MEKIGRKLSRRCGGEITIATEGMVIQVSSDSIDESERIAMGVLGYLRGEKKQMNWITSYL